MILYQVLYTFQQCKNFENRLRFDKLTDNLKVGTFFLRHSVDYTDPAVQLSYHLLFRHTVSNVSYSREHCEYHCCTLFL